MKRKQLLGTVIPVFMMTAVISSGYAIWHFNNLMTSASQSVNTEVTQHVEIGTVSKASDFSIVFDQTQEGRKKALEAASMSSSDIDADLAKYEAHGIYLNWNSSNTNNIYDQTSSVAEGTTINKVATYTSPTSEGAVDHSTDNQALNTYFDVVIDLGANISKHVNITTTNSNFRSTTASDSKKIVFSSTNANSATFNKEFSWEKVTFAYKSEPSNAETYKTLLDDVDGKSITVTYYAYVDSSAHSY